MPKYEILATNHVLYSIIVEADNEQEAGIIAAGNSIDLWSKDDEEFEIDFNSVILSN